MAFRVACKANDAKRRFIPAVPVPEFANVSISLGLRLCWAFGNYGASLQSVMVGDDGVPIRRVVALAPPPPPLRALSRWFDRPETPKEGALVIFWVLSELKLSALSSRILRQEERILPRSRYALISFSMATRSASQETRLVRNRVSERRSELVHFEASSSQYCQCFELACIPGRHDDKLFKSYRGIRDAECIIFGLPFDACQEFCTVNPVVDSPDASGRP